MSFFVHSHLIPWHHLQESYGMICARYIPKYGDPIGASNIHAKIALFFGFFFNKKIAKKG